MDSVITGVSLAAAVLIITGVVKYLVEREAVTRSTTVILEIDGGKLAEFVVPHIPSSVTRYKVGART